LEVSFDARLSVDRDGDSLTFHWDFGDGSPITAGATAGHVYRTDGPHVVQMIVEDSNGGTEITTVTVLVGNLPSSNVTSPARDATFNAGDIVNYSGIGTDAKDGILPARAFSWSIFLHHGNRTDPGHYAQLFLGPINSVKTGSFLVPLNLNGSEVWFSLHLTVTDSDGLTHESQQDFFPNLTVLTFRSSPPGLTVNLDGQLRATPIHEKSITGSIRTIGAPYPQVADKKKYKFESWSDGGSATHIVITPGSAATYRATYAVEPNFDPSLVGYWAFDERSDARAFDSSGSGNHATLLNQPNWTPGKVAGALSFDGTDDFVKVEDSADRSLDMGARDFTIVAWVKTSSSFWNSDRFRVIVAKASSISYGDTKTNGWGLLIGSNNRLSLVLPGLNPGDFVSDAGTLSTDT
jgi:PKD repeat protein